MQEPGDIATLNGMCSSLHTWGSLIRQTDTMTASMHVSCSLSFNLNYCLAPLLGCT